ncbi:MAG TPA: Wzz/FepE/Etk N-terminal domain-containing protein [Terriglobales bacterium]|jgi:polysaccharide chain length determinant protein (PEP-CTERM system associated)|nr:Wzz/FepE/Etk N-terminal domain-containing protein [Terriglobales bacterium]
MIENRELTVDDYLAILRRRFKVILIPMVLAPIVAFLASYAFPAKYTSTALVQVEEQQVPGEYVKPAVSEDLSGRVASLQYQVLSRSQLQLMVNRLGLAPKGGNVDGLIDQIQQAVSIQLVQTGAPGKPKKPGDTSEAPGFNVNVTWDNPKIAQQICTEITSMITLENLRSRGAVTQGTTEFLAQQLETAKGDLNDQDRRLADFKRLHMGQLPGDTDNNMKLLAGMNSQLDANTQTLNRAEQDKSYTESMLAQQLAAWRSTQNSTNPQTLQQQLAALQTQLLALQARYTDDYPDVIKTKSDIAQTQRRLNELDKAASSSTDTTAKSGVAEPAEIQQLRTQIHQYSDAIAQATRDQKRLQENIQTYQGRVNLSPAVEEQYKQLTRDYDTAQKGYDDLLAKENQAKMQGDMERRQQGEQMNVLNPAGFPDSPSFPVRWEFAAGGLGGGLALGLIVVLWLEMRDKSIRSEQDVIAALDLPMLVSVPWIGTDAGDRASDGRLHLRPRSGSRVNQKIVEV